MFSSDQETYPFHPKATYHPSSDRCQDDPITAYQETLNERGVDRAVLVQPEPYGDDHSLVLDCAYTDPERFRATSLFYPQDPAAPEKLRELVGEHGDMIVATRFHTTEPYMDSFDDPGVRELWKTASELDLVVELHLNPSYAHDARELISTYPSTPVLIDHLAEPQTGNPVEYGDVLTLAEFKNVYMKLSALDHFADDPPLFERVRPFTSWVVDAFGPKRMAWGKGSPQIVDCHLGGYSRAERELVKGDNAYEFAWQRGNN